MTTLQFSVITSELHSKGLLQLCSVIRGPHECSASLFWLFFAIIFRCKNSCLTCCARKIFQYCKKLIGIILCSTSFTLSAPTLKSHSFLLWFQSLHFALVLLSVVFTNPQFRILWIILTWILFPFLDHYKTVRMDLTLIPVVHYMTESPHITTTYLKVFNQPTMFRFI